MLQASELADRFRSDECQIPEALTGAARDEKLADEWAFAMEVLAAEARAIQDQSIDAAFHQAVDLIADVTREAAGGSLVISGVGKSGMIGRKLAATFASTGTPSHFVHPTEALHGDLGCIRRQDAVLMMSFRGETEEIITLASHLHQLHVSTIAVTRSDNSSLSRIVQLTITIGEIEEADGWGIVPTSSTAAMLAVGDALALSVSRRRGFSRTDFHRLHPGGLLGRELLPVTKVMRRRAGIDLRLVQPQTSIRCALEQVEAPNSTRHSGAFVIVDITGCLVGIFTDADLWRALTSGGRSVLDDPIGTHMTRQPLYLSDAAVVRDAVALMQQHGVDELPIVDGSGWPVGLIDVQDLAVLGVMHHGPKA